MGISRDRRHKHRATGGRMPIHKKKRKFELGRAPAMTKLGPRRVRPLRCRGDITRKARIIQVVYNASNNELVRTNTLVKNTIVVIDATSFKQWYITRYGIDLGKKKHSKDGEEEINEALVNVGEMTKKKRATRAAQQKLDPAIEEQFASGRLLACISSRPGQIGRADGYLLEGPELQFYKRKLEKKKSK